MEPQTSDLSSPENTPLDSDNSFYFQTLLLVVIFFVLWINNYLTFYLGYDRAVVKLHDLFYSLFKIDVFNFRLDGSTEKAPYLSSSLLLASLKNPIILAGLIFNNVFVCFHYNALRWKNFESSKQLKYFIFFIALILAWHYSTYDYNLYVNQAHYFDRVFLVFSAGLVLVHPAFTALFVPALLLVVSQFNYPQGLHSLTSLYLPCNILLAFIAFMHLIVLTRYTNNKLRTPDGLAVREGGKFLSAVSSVFPVSLVDRKINWKLFLYITLCICASFYFAPGLKKIWISPNMYDWPFLNELYMHTIWKIDAGWLAFLDYPVKQQVVQWVKLFNTPMMLSAAVVEFAAIFILFRKKLTIFCLLSFCALHLMIFLESGILFWKWTLLDFAIIVLLISLPEKPFADIFGRKKFVFSIFIIFFSMLYFRPVPLGWWDTKNKFKLQIEAVGESGKHYRIQESLMSPYHLLFSYQRYDFIVDEKLLYPSGSTSSFKRFMEVRNTGKEGLPDLKEKFGENHYNEEKADELDKFLKVFFQNLNERMDKKTIFSYLAAPHHVYFDDLFNKPMGSYQLQEKLAVIKIRFVENYYENGKVILIQEKIVRSIPIL